MSRDERRPGLRADARRNRDAIVAAARAVFSEQGLDAPIDAVAARAGVGRGTVYRRFPTREDLVDAVHHENLHRLERVAAEATAPDTAFFDLLGEAARILWEDRGFGELLRRRTVSGATGERATARFLAIVTEPLASARRAGHVRADLRPDDALLIVDMLGGVTLAAGRAQAPARQERALELIRAAVAPTSAHSYNRRASSRD
jgi:AcrR family transcriptional regulator